MVKGIRVAIFFKFSIFKVFGGVIYLLICIIFIKLFNYKSLKEIKNFIDFILVIFMKIFCFYIDFFLKLM